jgi:hypothetical protein
METSIKYALQVNGLKVQVDSRGFITVTGLKNRMNYKIWTTARPPEVSDFHHTDISNPGQQKIILGPEFIETRREVLNGWLSSKSTIQFYNEGEILHLTNLICQ